MTNETIEFPEFDDEDFKEEEMRTVTPAELLGEVEDEENDPPNPEAEEDAVGFYKTLVDKGILEDSEEFAGTWDALDSELSNIPNRLKSGLIESTQGSAKKVVDYIFSGDTVDEDSFNTFLKTLIEDQKQPDVIDVEDVSVAEKYVRQKFSQTHMEDDEIDVLIDTLKDKEEDDAALIKKAKQLQALDTKEEKARADELLAKRKEIVTKEKEQEEAFVTNVMSELDSLEWKDKRKAEVKKQLVSNKTNEVFQTAFSNPKALLQLANLSLFYDAKKGEFDFSEFLTQQVSKKVNSLKENITRNNYNSNKGKGTTVAKMQETMANLTPIL